MSGSDIPIHFEEFGELFGSMLLVRWAIDWLFEAPATGGFKDYDAGRSLAAALVAARDAVSTILAASQEVADLAQSDATDNSFFQRYAWSEVDDCLCDLANVIGLLRNKLRNASATNTTTELLQGLKDQLTLTEAAMDLKSATESIFACYPEICRESAESNMDNHSAALANSSRPGPLNDPLTTGDESADAEMLATAMQASQLGS